MKRVTQIKPQTGLAAAYVRVSTLDQGERYSLPSQLRALRELASRNGKKIPEDWVFLDKHTGKLDRRPGFDKLKALVRTSQPDTVLIYDISRFARKTLDALWLKAEFHRHGVDLAFVEVPYEDTPTGRLTFTQLAAVAEYVGEKIVEDSNRGRLEKLQGGKLDHGGAADGYRYIDKKQKDGCRLEINPPRAKIWQRIYHERGIEHKPFYAIARQLNEEGIPNASGGLWVPRTISQNVDNPTYMGEHRRSGIIVPCPAIVSRELWEACQRIKPVSNRQNVGRPSRRYLLTRFLWCSKPGCGHRMLSNPGWGARPYYRCGHIEHTPFTRKCHAPLVYQDVIEPAAWQEIWRLVTDPDFLFASAQNYCDSRQKTQTPDTTAIEQERSQLEAKIKTTRRMLQDQIIPYDEGWADIRASQARLAQIDGDLRTDGLDVLQLPAKHQAQALFSGLREDLEEPVTFEERRPILEKIRDLKMLYYEGLLEIEGKLPLPAKSTTCSKGPVQKNSVRGLDPDDNSFPQIVTYFPFRISKRVA